MDKDVVARCQKRELISQFVGIAALLHSGATMLEANKIHPLIVKQCVTDACYYDALVNELENDEKV